MKNQETTTKMTEQEKQELMDLLMRPRTPEQEAEWQAQMKKDYDEIHKAFLEQHDWFEKPSVQTRSAAAWTRDNILLDSWNQYINCTARESEFFGEHPEGKGFRSLGEMRRCDIALGFAHFFLASITEQVRYIDEEVEK